MEKKVILIQEQTAVLVGLRLTVTQIKKCITMVFKNEKTKNKENEKTRL
jgi:hypothetical protein